MAQLNINLTPQFKKDLERYMKHRKIQTKSEALRAAMREVVSLISVSKKVDYMEWVGAALKSPTNEKPTFKSEDDLWSA